MAAYLFFFFAHVPWLFHLLEESLELAFHFAVQQVLRKLFHCGS